MIYTKKRWSNSKKTNIKGKVFDSKFEGEYSLVLDQMVKEGKIERYERQVKLELNVNNYHICNYYVDFIAFYPNGELTEYIEVKGLWFAEAKLKFKLFEALFSELPNTKITVIQQGNSLYYPKIRKLK